MDIKKIITHMKRNFRQMASIDRQRFWMHIILTLRNCCKKKSNSHSRYNWYLRKSESMITKELDLRKHLKRQRVNTTAILGLLSGRQSFFVDKMAQMIIREDDSHES